ncbi:MAG: ISAs1 family transposase [Bacillota bacterium]
MLLDKLYPIRYDSAQKSANVGVESMSDEKYEGKFFNYFITIYDPRQDEKVKHKLIDVIFIVVCAMICNCNDWPEIEIWAERRQDWLSKYLELPNGIPSQYTYQKVFDVIDPKQFGQCFTQWIKDVTEASKGTVVALDGKMARGTAEKDQKAIHIVNAWCSSNKMILGQAKTEEKSNEITAVPELLNMLFLKGCIITVDAMNTQKKADYVVALESTNWSLDVTFGEDASRTRKGKAPENLALLRRLAMNVVKKDQEKYAKRSLKAKRFRASLNTDYLDYLLGINF